MNMETIEILSRLHGWLRWWVGDWGVWLLAAMLAACVLELRPRRSRRRR